MRQKLVKIAILNPSINFNVPIGGCLVFGYDVAVINAIAQFYPGWVTQILFFYYAFEISASCLCIYF